MLDRLTGLQVFGRVAALGSLSAAARALSMSQTMATKHMTALEERLGVKLLHRTTRRVTLTDAGRSYLDSVERILSDIDDADAAVSAATRDVRGTLRVNVPVGFGTREVAPLELGLTLTPRFLSVGGDVECGRVGCEPGEVREIVVEGERRCGIVDEDDDQESLQPRASRRGTGELIVISEQRAPDGTVGEKAAPRREC